MPLLALGFRPFFLLASTWAVLAMGTWILVLSGGANLPLAGLAPVTWHAHELVYGYGVCVVAGFLLTAVRNWTGRDTPTGPALAGIAALWAVPRVLLLIGSAAVLPLAAVFDVGFTVVLLLAVARPIVAVRQWRQSGILSKLAMLAVGQALFYAGAAGALDEGVRWGLLSGVYLVLGLVLTILRRVYGFFATRALPGAGEPVQREGLDRVALAAFLALYLVDTFSPWRTLAAALAGLLALLHGVRLAGWWLPGTARVPLLWVLLLAYALVVFGFALQAVTPWLGLSPFLALHAHAVGGIGLTTLGMMARVTLGHTGRDVRSPSRMLAAVFSLGAGAALVRVLGPLLAPAATTAALHTAQTLWVLAFGALLGWGLPMWLRPRPDGLPG